MAQEQSQYRQEMNSTYASSPSPSARGDSDTPYRRSSNGEASSWEIKNNIEHTRAEMDETIDELSGRLQPRQLLDEVMDMFRSKRPSKDAVKAKAGSAASFAGHQAKDLGVTVLHKLKEHPVPAALMGAGLAWLVAEDIKRSSRSTSPYYAMSSSRTSGYRPSGIGSPSPTFYAEFEYEEVADLDDIDWEDQSPGARERAKSKARDLASRIRSAAHAAREKAAGAADSTRSGISRAASGARHGVSDMSHRTDEMRATARERAREARAMARERYESGCERFTDAADHHPLAMGIAVMGLGLLGGLLVPTTRQEDRFMGGRSEDFKRRARSMAGETAHAAGEVASATARAAADEARRQGLTPRDLGERARHFASDVKRAADDSAHREGVAPDDLADKARSVAREAGSVAREETSRHKDEISGRHSSG